MSLSEQLGRVDGSQNATLKILLQKLGAVFTGAEKIDQYPTLAAGVSTVAPFVKTFDADDWTAAEDDSECTITIPAGSHGLSGLVSCRAFVLQDGAYRPGRWAALETWAEVASDGSAVLHYPSATGYAGCALLTSVAVSASSSTPDTGDNGEDV